MSILTFVLCHNLTGSALCNLLSLISLHCLQPNLLKSSVYLFRKHFDNLRYPIIKHYFCSACFSRLESNDSICETCHARKGISYFIEIPIVKQLQTLFQRRGFYESLQYRFNRKKIKTSNFEDIYDGKVYKALFENDGFLSNPNNISFTWNTDGVSIFKSSGYAIWPFYLSINELPYDERTKSDNVLLAGLWFGQVKPEPNLFMRPFHSALKEIYEGINVDIPSNNAPIKLRGMVMCGTCNLPAKALFLNMTQFNGKYGCPKCKLRGQSEQSRWTYPFQRKLSHRSDKETHAFAKTALRINVPVYGIKGPSLLSQFVHKFMRTTVVDSMHCVFLGVTKQLCTIWFDSKHKYHPASLIEFMKLIDSRLRALSPPDFLQRRPRSIAKHLKYWKANELKAWLFYYSIPILRDIMPQNYFDHYCHFVIAIYALHMDSISSKTLKCASQLLIEFVNRFDVLYGVELMSCNLHQLLHISDTVRDFGPLWTASCFPYEDLNGKLKRLVHSSRGPELQICSGLASILSLSTTRHQSLVFGSAAYDFCSQLSNARKKINTKYLTEGICSVGQCREVFPLPEIVSQALASINIVGRKFLLFSRLRKDCSLFTAQSYPRSVRYNNTCVLYNHNDLKHIGIINCFVKIYNCDCMYEDICECCTPSYAIIRRCTLSSILPKKILKHVPELVLECKDVAEQAIAINVDQLVSICFLLKISDTNKCYVAFRANVTEIE